MEKRYEKSLEDAALKNIENDLLWNRKKNHELKNRIMMSIDKLESPERMKKNLNISLMRKITYCSATIIILIGLFIGSAFLSPAMAEMAAKIPYLNLLFESEKKPVINEINEALDENGYKWDGLGVAVQPKEVSVMIVGSDDYYNQVKTEVEDLIKDILKARKYDAYSVKVSKAEIYMEPTQEDEERLSEAIIIKDVVVEVLEKYGITNPDWPQIKNKELELQIPNKVTNIDEIKKEIVEILEEKEMGKFSIKVFTYNPQKREREGRWMPIVQTISDGLTSKSEFKVKTVGYTNKFNHLPLSIYTTLSSSDKDADETVKAIEKTIQDYLSSEKVKNIIKNDQYEVIIYSNDDKVMN